VRRDSGSIECIAAQILSGDPAGATPYLIEARKQNKLSELFEAILKGPPPFPQAKIAFQTAWTAEEGLRLRDVFPPGKDVILLDVLAKMLPGYSGPPIELFRGERGSNHEARTYGPSWTSKRNVAEMFARGLNCCPQTGGVLLRTEAPANAVLAPPNDHSHYLGELEYVVDRRALNWIEVLESFLPRR
jgi:hypothetical protein